VVPADWAATLPQGAIAQCSLVDGTRFTETSYSAGQQYISIRGARLPLAYGDAVWYDSNGNSRVIDMPQGYVENHGAVPPPNTMMQPTGSYSQYFWDGSLAHYIADPGTSACFLNSYPQNGVARVPASWMAVQPQGTQAQCSLVDGTRFTETSYSGGAQYISIRGARLPVAYNDAVWYDANGNSRVIDMPTGYLENHGAVPPGNSLLQPTGSYAQFFWDGAQSHWIPDGNTSACLLNRYPQNGVARVPASWMSAQPQGANQTCS
jgi:hypothetical protein